jgi:peptide-methionine (S)-S-oxide reductase
MDIATLGGGCFWCLEAALRQLAGVESVVSGYCGGGIERPSYSLVCTGDSGHAEVVRISFDPTVIDYRTLLEAFFAIHDPTTKDRQGNDVGSQYRSAIFTHSAQQERIAHALIAELTEQGIWPQPIVTEVLPAPAFWPAEDYHQDYYDRNGKEPYCHIYTKRF